MPEPGVTEWNFYWEKYWAHSVNRDIVEGMLGKRKFQVKDHRLDLLGFFVFQVYRRKLQVKLKVFFFVYLDKVLKKNPPCFRVCSGTGHL